MLPSSSAIWRARAAVLLDHHHFVAGVEQLLGQVVADISAADDDHVHGQLPSAVAALSGWVAALSGWVRGAVRRMGAAHGLRRGLLDHAVRGGGALGGRLHQGLGQDGGAADGLQAQRPIRLGPERVVDLGDDPRNAEHVLGQLGGHDVAVVALGQGHDDLGHLGLGAAQDVLVAPVAPDRDPAVAARQLLEGAGIDVDHGHVVAAFVQPDGGLGPHPSTADDDDPHGESASSSVRARRHHTGAFEFRMT